MRRQKFFYFGCASLLSVALNARAEFGYNSSATDNSCNSLHAAVMSQPRPTLETFRAWALCERDQRLFAEARAAVTRLPLVLVAQDPQDFYGRYRNYGWTYCDSTRLENLNYTNRNNATNYLPNNNSGHRYSSNVLLRFECITEPLNTRGRNRWLVKLQIKINSRCLNDAWDTWIAHIFNNDSTMVGHTYENDHSAQALEALLKIRLNSDNPYETICGPEIPLCDLAEADQVANVWTYGSNGPLVAVPRPQQGNAPQYPTSKFCMVPSMIAPDGSYPIYPFDAKPIERNKYCRDRKPDMDAALGEQFCRGFDPNSRQQQRPGNSSFGDAYRIPTSLTDSLSPTRVRYDLKLR